MPTPMGSPAGHPSRTRPIVVVSRDVRCLPEEKMSFTHIHLLLNHFPVIGSVIGLTLIGYALYRRNSDLTKVSLALFVVLAAIALVVYFTGEPAEEAIENIAGFSEAITEQHEEAALVATIVMGTFGALALSALMVFRTRTVPRWISLVSLVAALAVNGVMGYAAMLGGQVRHTEVRNGAAAIGAPGTQGDE